MAAESEDHSKLQRPPLRSNFDLEPNPFEQSFSSSRTTANESSSSSVTTQGSLKRGEIATTTNATTKGETPKPMLPPLASLASPSDQSFAWGMSSHDVGSLRSGPLSPAMLAGPQQNGQSLSAFDAASFGRTGLTPSTGLTPLVGGPVSFPPPSPNTAAFLAMVSNSTAAANLASTTAATITPNTLSAITGVLNSTTMPPSSYQSFAPPRSDFPANGQADNTQQQQQQQQPQQQVNGLFLLSQAHQELAKREEAQRASTSAEPAMNPQDAAVQPRRAAKRKSSEAHAPETSPVAASAARSSNKKPRAAAAKSKRAKRGESISDDDDDDDDDDDSDREITSPTMSGPTTKGSKKPETEEEKRRNFLERNRQAALKCRQRKKAWLAQLQAKVEYLTTENERLNAALLKSSEEINRLTALVNAASVVPAGGGPPVSVSVSMSGSHKNDPQPLPMTAVVGGRRGYGY